MDLFHVNIWNNKARSIKLEIRSTSNGSATWI